MTFVEGKEQVIAHLANFAYDPINYDWLLRLNVVDLFLDVLDDDEEQEKLKEFAIGGICNFSLDARVSKIIEQSENMQIIIKCLSSSNINSVMSTITTLYYILTSKNKKEIALPEILESIQKYSLAEDTRLRNIAAVFLEQCASIK